MNEVDNRTVSVDYPTKVLMQFHSERTRLTAMR